MVHRSLGPPGRGSGSFGAIGWPCFVDCLQGFRTDLDKQNAREENPSNLKPLEARVRARRTGRLLVVNPGIIRRTWATSRNASQGRGATFWQVSTGFLEKRQDTAECLLNVKGRTLKSCQPNA